MSNLEENNVDLITKFKNDKRSMDRIDLAQKIHQTAKDKGWWDNERNHDQMFMLMITELSEAVEADREDRHCPNKHIFKDLLDNPKEREDYDQWYKDVFEHYVKDKVEDEISDTYIRCLDYLYYRHGSSIIFPSYHVSQWEENFAANIFRMCRLICDYRIKDVVYEIEDFCETFDIDLQWHVKAKMKYNDKREHKDGGKKY